MPRYELALILKAMQRKPPRALPDLPSRPPASVLAFSAHHQYYLARLHQPTPQSSPSLPPCPLPNYPYVSIVPPVTQSGARSLEMARRTRTRAQCRPPDPQVWVYRPLCRGDFGPHHPPPLNGHACPIARAPSTSVYGQNHLFPSPFPPPQKQKESNCSCRRPLVTSLLYSPF
nr:small ribosomal subunit protein bS6m isoform X2 [Dasypus novemcinctus]